VQVHLHTIVGNKGNTLKKGQAIEGLPFFYALFSILSHSNVQG
jgi:hypothetical protein